MNEIRLLKTDGKTETLPDSGGETADFRITHLSENDVHTLTLVPKREGLSLNAVEYEVDLSPTLLSPSDRLFFYNNGAHTNDITYVKAYIGNENTEFSELAVFKNLDSNEVSLYGYLTARRFWASMFLRTDKIVFRFELEDRILNCNETYELENFMIGKGTDNERALLENYGETVGKINRAVPNGNLPTGWCSWSCYYSAVNEEKIRRAADSQAAYTSDGYPKVIQIDDGWQANGSFCGEWFGDEKKFPHGIAATADYVIDKGMTFGLWLAPLLLSEGSEHYGSLKHIAQEDITLGNCHPFDLGNPEYHEHLRKTFRRMVDEYHARYFKLDFLAASVRFFNENGKFVKFKNGFCVEVLRSALQTIRDTVGDDVYLLACGAQTLIGAGILNGARMSCDIIWGKSPSYPSYWELMKDCTKTVMRRYFFHRNVYINDADGLVLRDIDIGDGFNSTYSEAALWAVSVAMSGGAVLSNDELELLSPGRRSLYTSVLPPLDIAGRPVDYFEQPEPTAYYIPVDDNTAFLAIYNFEDKIAANLNFDLEKIGMKGAFAVRCIETKALGFMETLNPGIMNPHEAQMYLLRKPSNEPSFAFSDANIYCGINIFDVAYKDGKLSVTSRYPEFHKDAKVYAFYPDGFKPEGEVILAENGYTIAQVK